MPYLGRERVELWNPWEWLTLPQAVDYIVKLDGVEPEEARQGIHYALIDGALELKWGAFGPRPNLSLPHREPEIGSPPVGGPLWQTADIDWDAGTVLDNFDPENGKNERRVLLIWRRRLVACFDRKALVPKLPEPGKPLRGNRASATLASETPPQSPPIAKTTRRRGPAPSQFERVKKEMLDGMRSGAVARDPRQMIEKQWEAIYRASRDTCRKALAAALSKIQAGNSDK